MSRAAAMRLRRQEGYLQIRNGRRQNGAMHGHYAWSWVGVRESPPADGASCRPLALCPTCSEKDGGDKW